MKDAKEAPEKTRKVPGKEFPENFHRYFVVLGHQTNPFEMYNSLIIKSFEKAKEEIHSDKPTHLAQHLSDYILEQSGEAYGEKSLRNHFTAAKNGEPIELKRYVADALSVYLEYAGFKAFVKANPSSPQPPKPFYKRYKWPLAGLVFILLVAWGYHQLTKERWMVWKDTHYVESKFDEKLLQEGILKLYKEDRIGNFRKIKLHCDTPYRNPDGTVRVWYGKNKAGELEYFTSHGLHPETGKTLRELSKYMFDKYVCPNTTNKFNNSSHRTSLPTGR